MDNETFLQMIEERAKSRIELLKRKNADYSGSNENPFRNFELIEIITKGRISAADGILVRLTDKVIRFANLLTSEARVADEKITDTLDDLANYADIVNVMIRGKAADR